MRYFPALVLLSVLGMVGCGGNPPPTVVFIGDSITYNWGQSWASPEFAQHPDWDNRGVVGQNSAQLLERFHHDVVSRHPHIVHILTGTNDVYPGWVLSGGSPVFDTSDNIIAMVAMAKAANIRVIVGTIPPWGPGVLPELKDPSSERYQRIDTLNQWIREYGRRNDLVVIDYHAVLVSRDDKTYVPALTVDGVHPSAAGYAVMSPLVEDSITALEKPKQ